MDFFGIAIENPFGGPSYCQHSRAWLENEIRGMEHEPAEEDEALAKQWCELRSYHFRYLEDASATERHVLVISGGGQIHSVVLLSTPLEPGVLVRIQDQAAHYSQEVQELPITLVSTLKEIETHIRELNPNLDNPEILAELRQLATDLKLTVEDIQQIGGIDSDRLHNGGVEEVIQLLLDVADDIEWLEEEFKRVADEKQAG